MQECLKLKKVITYDKAKLFNITFYRSIVVTNFSMSTTPDVLKLYFENKKRSNGGEVESVDSLLNEVYIVFKNAEGT